MNVVTPEGEEVERRELFEPNNCVWYTHGSKMDTGSGGDPEWGFLNNYHHGHYGGRKVRRCAFKHPSIAVNRNCAVILELISFCNPFKHSTQCEGSLMNTYYTHNNSFDIQMSYNVEILFVKPTRRYGPIVGSVVNRQS